jgi:hypothetical protein
LPILPLPFLPVAQFTVAVISGIHRTAQLKNICGRGSSKQLMSSQTSVLTNGRGAFQINNFVDQASREFLMNDLTGETQCP